MKKFIIIYFLIAFQFAFSQDNKIAIIPEPVSVTTRTGNFILPKTVEIEAPDHSDLKEALKLFSQRLSLPTGIPVTIKKKCFLCSY